MSPDPKAVLWDIKGGENVPSFWCIGAQTPAQLLCFMAFYFSIFLPNEMLMSTEDSKARYGNKKEVEGGQQREGSKGCLNSLHIENRKLAACFKSMIIKHPWRVLQNIYYMVTLGGCSLFWLSFNFFSESGMTILALHDYDED